MLEPIFEAYKLTTGYHEIRFHVSPAPMIGYVPYPYPSVAIDEVSIFSIETPYQYPTLSLKPDIITLPLLEQPQALYVELTIQNVSCFKAYSFELDYNRTILEFMGAKMDDAFYATTGGYIEGDEFQGTLRRTFSGSTTMFVYVFKILNTGSTQINIVNSKTDFGLLASHKVTNCTITIKSLVKWIDGQYAELKERYDKLSVDFQMLNTTYHKLLADCLSLNATYHALLMNYSDLNFNFDKLQTSYNALNATHYRLLTNYNSLQSTLEAITNELNITRTLTCIFTATTIIFIARAAYFAIRKHKAKK